MQGDNPNIGFSGMPFAQMIMGSLTLTARMRELREQCLARQLAEETGTKPSDITARVTAAQFTSALEVLSHKSRN